MKLRFGRKMAVAVATVLVLALMPLFGEAAHQTGMMQDATVRFNQETFFEKQPRVFEAEVWIDGASNLGGFEFTLAFNPLVVQVQDVQVGPFLGSTGRDTGPLGPVIDNGAGSLDFGGLSWGAADGAEGSGILALITLQMVGTGASTLDLSGTQVVDTQASSQSVNEVDSILSGLAGFGCCSSSPDFDGDGASDIGFYRDGIWGILESTAGFDYDAARWFAWGTSADFPLIGDSFSDGLGDPTVLHPPQGGQSAAFLVLKSSTGYDYGQAGVIPAGWPVLGDTPILADFDGDGGTDLGLWRASTGVWVIAKSSAAFADYIFALWGAMGDSPVAGDFDGDGAADIGFYRDGTWGVLLSSEGFDFNASWWKAWGGAADMPMVGDFDGDGKADPTVYHPPEGGQSAAFLVLKSSTGYDYGQIQVVPAGWPSLGDIPVIGDWNADGITDLGIWRESEGVWMIGLAPGFGSYIFAQWGSPGDVPLVP